VPPTPEPHVEIGHVVRKERDKMIDQMMSLKDLDDDTRLALADLLELRNKYLSCVFMLNEIRVQALRGTGKFEAAADFSSVVVAPIRAQVTEGSLALVKAAFNEEAFMEMLPMLVLVATNVFNVPLALTALGIDPDSIQELLNMIKDVIDG
jgi:hypothetical protein